MNKMKLIYFLILLIITQVNFGRALNATEGSASQDSIKTEKLGDDLFLWKTNSETSTVYLLGSIHFAKKDIYPLDQAIEESFKQSDHLVLELKMDQQSQMKIQQKIMSLAFYPKGDSLEKHVNDETLKLLKEKLKEKGMSFEQMKQFKPWMLSLQLMAMEWVKAGYNPQNGIDMYFQQKATQDGKKVLALETPEQQIELITSGDDQMHELNLKQTLENLDEMNDSLSEIFKAWESGDELALNKLIKEALSEDQYKPLYKKMFTNRNIKMAEKIDQFLKTDKTYFVVVGAGHLVGNDSVVKFLEKKGHQFERMKRKKALIAAQ